MNGALPGLGELFFLETFQDLAEQRAPHCSVLEGLLEVNPPHSKWGTRVGPPEDHLQSGEPREGKKATTLRTTPRGSQEPETRICRNFASASRWAIWSLSVSPEPQVVKPLMKEGGKAPYILAMCV